MDQPRSLQKRFRLAVESEFAAQPLRPAQPLEVAALAHLPAPVQRFIRRSGAVGKPKPQNTCVEFDSQMWRKPDARPMAAPVLQYNFFGRPARIFLMKAHMFAVPVRALHIYSQEQATFTVRVASMANMVDHSGPEISAAETVTLLNDMCFFAPGALVDDRLEWEAVDDRTCTVAFTNGAHRVGAELHFNEGDELIDFVSDHRPASQNDGTLRPLRWSTPFRDYREIDGLRIPTSGDAVYEYPEGDFTYGRFHLASIEYDRSHPR